MSKCEVSIIILICQKLGSVGHVRQKIELLTDMILIEVLFLSSYLFISQQITSKIPTNNLLSQGSCFCF